MPTKDRIGGDERSDFGESPSPNGLASDGKSSALIVGQPKSSASELVFEYSVFLAEILDDRILLPGDPSGQCGDEDLPRLKDDCHPGIVALGWRNRQLPGAG